MDDDDDDDNDDDDDDDGILHNILPENISFLNREVICTISGAK